jgi:hypothetical protein
MMPDMEQEVRHLLWFVGGFALAAILSVSYQAVRYVPMAVAFGLLCFGCGALLVLFLSLRRRGEESFAFWKKALAEKMEEKSELEKEKQAFETEKQGWDEEKVEWEEKRVLWEVFHEDEPNSEESK